MHSKLSPHSNKLYLFEELHQSVQTKHHNNSQFLRIFAHDQFYIQYCAVVLDKRNHLIDTETG